MRLFLLLLAVVLATAAPGRYQHHYQFQQSSSAYKNNELQHKEDEAGSYHKHGETDSDAAPQEHATYMHQEYHKPEELDSQKPVDVSSFLDGMRQDTNTQGQGGRFSFGQSGNTQHHYQQSSSRFESSSHGYGGYRRPGYRNTQVSGTTSGKLEEIDDDDITDYSRFQSHGFGKEYLENTEGGSNHGKPRQDNTNIYQQGGSRTSSVGHSRDLVTSGSSHHGSHSTFDQEFGGQEQLTQQTQDIFGEDYNQNEDLTQQTQDGFGKLEFGNQEDLTQQTQDGFGKLEFGDQEHDQMNQQTQHGFDQFQQNEDLTQQTQDGFGKLEFGGQEHDQMTQQTQHDFEQFQQNEDLTQQTQDGFGKLEFGGQEHDQMSQQTQHGFEQFQQNEDLTQQTQDGFGKLEFGGQEHDQMSQQTQHGFGQFQENEDLTQQTQDGFSTFEFGSQHDINQQTSVAGQAKLNRGNTAQYTTQQIAYGGHHMTQQSQYGFGKLETGGEERDEFTTQTQHEFDQREMGGQEREDFTQQTQHSFGQENEHFTQQTQHEFGQLEMGDHHKDFSQQSQHGFDQMELGGQEKGDFTQQTQHGYEQLEMGSHYKDDFTQQTQNGFGQEKDDFTQQTQDGFDQFTQSQKENKLGKLEYGQEKDITQQTQDEFGHFELGSQQKEVTSGKYEYDQQKEDGYDQLQVGSFSSAYGHQSQYGPHKQYASQVYEEIPDETDQDMMVIEDIAQYAHKINEASKQAQPTDITLDKVDHHDFNKESSHDILAEKEIKAKVEEIPPEVSPTTKKPGFWRRIGSSISETYETAKEKTKALAEKVKQNIG